MVYHSFDGAAWTRWTSHNWQLPLIAVPLDNSSLSLLFCSLLSSSSVIRCTAASGPTPGCCAGAEVAEVKEVDELEAMLYATFPVRHLTDSDLDGFESANEWAEDDPRGAAPPRQTALLEADPYSSPLSNRPPGFICGGDQHATPYYALRQAPPARADQGQRPRRRLRPGGGPPFPEDYFLVLPGGIRRLLVVVVRGGGSLF